MKPLRLSFDRGTVLIEGDEALLRSMDLPDLLWDPRVFAFRAPASSYGALTQALKALGRPVVDALCHAVAGPATAPALPSLRGYQQHAVASWKLNGCRGLVVMPTGSGKTRVAIAAMAELSCATLVLVPTRVLLTQWQTELTRHDAGPIGIFGDGQKQLAPVTVATFESAYRHLDSFGARFSLLVVDEVHHFGSGVRAEALEMCSATRRLGLTATPPQSPEATRRLDALVGPLVCHYAIGDLAGEHLAPFSRERLYVDLTASERADYDAARGAFTAAYRQFRKGGIAGWQAFCHVAALSAAGRQALRGFFRSRQIVNHAADKLTLAGEILRQHAAERVLVFTGDNHAAYAVSRRLLIPAMTCDIGRKEREQILDDLRQRRVRAIVSARVLNEGVDLPEASVGLILGGTQGEREHVQRVGRLLRPQQGKRATVYELVARRTHEVEDSYRRQSALAL